MDKTKKKENRKVRNANPKEYGGIQFKSVLERNTYRTLKDAGFDVEYEPLKITVWQGFRPTVPFYNRDNRTRRLKLETKKLIDITYTPDFVFTHNGTTVYIETKGFENDAFPIKKKLFRKWLEEQEARSVYFEIFSKAQLLQAIDIIKSL